MADAPPLPATAPARLWMPRLALAGCVRGAMLRDTRGCGLAGEQRRSFFPASPLMALTWWLHGSAEWIDMPGFLPAQPLDPGCGFWLSGPFTGPTVMQAPGEGQSLQLLFQPDALHAMLGLRPADFVNRVVPANPWLPPDWRAWAAGLAQAADDEARLCLIEDFLASRWTSHHRPAPQRYRDWAEGLALRAATSDMGRSLRQAERRIKAWAGLPLRELRAHGRAEAAFLDHAGHDGAARLADLAAAHGYADQSHFTRETRRLTGFSPAELERRLRTDEAFWAYRLWN